MVGSATQFITFTQRAFDAEVIAVTRLNGNSEGIIHGEMRIGNATLYFADTSHDGSCGPQCHNPDADSLSSIQLFIYVEDAGDTQRLAIEAGAVEIMEVSDQGDGRMGGIIDPFGNLWWIKSMN
jgi:uncharacterized glyoxalase superfamily protein PhnB